MSGTEFFVTLKGKGSDNYSFYTFNRSFLEASTSDALPGDLKRRDDFEYAGHWRVRRTYDHRIVYMDFNGWGGNVWKDNHEFLHDLGLGRGQQAEKLVTIKAVGNSYDVRFTQKFSDWLDTNTIHGYLLSVLHCEGGPLLSLGFNSQRDALMYKVFWM